MIYLSAWLLITSLTWLAFFAGYASKNRYQGKPNKFTKVIDSIFIYAIDIPCSWFLTIIPFLDLPASWDETVTARLKRYKAIPEIIVKRNTTKMDWYRYDVARWLCSQLNKSDKDHC